MHKRQLQPSLVFVQHVTGGTNCRKVGPIGHPPSPERHGLMEYSSGCFRRPSRPATSPRPHRAWCLTVDVEYPIYCFMPFKRITEAADLVGMALFRIAITSTIDLSVFFLFHKHTDTTVLVTIDIVRQSFIAQHFPTSAGPLCAHLTFQTIDAGLVLVLAPLLYCSKAQQFVCFPNSYHFVEGFLHRISLLFDYDALLYAVGDDKNLLQSSVLSLSGEWA